MRARHSESGFALLFVFALAAIVAIMLYMELPRVAFEAQRNKEQLLVDRGEQYKRAIKVFYRTLGRYPATLDQLDNTNNIRFLRHHYKDPMTGKEEWRLIHFNGGAFTDSLTLKPPAVDPNSQQAGGSGTTAFGQTGTGSTLFNSGGNAPNPNTTPPDPNAAGYGTNPADPNAPQVPSSLERRRRRGLPLPGSTTQPNDPYATQNPYGQDPNQQPGQDPNQYPAGQQPDPNQPTGQPGAVQQPAFGGNQPQPGFPGSIPLNPGGQPVNPAQPGSAGTTGGAYPGQPPQPFNPYNPAPIQPQQPPMSGPNQPMQPLGPPTVPQAITNQLMNPRPQGFTGFGSAGGNQPTVMGGGIAGVASKAEDEGIMVYNKKTKYNEWEFIYDPRTDQGSAFGPQGLGVQGFTPPMQPGAPGMQTPPTPTGNPPTPGFNPNPGFTTNPPQQPGTGPTN